MADALKELRSALNATSNDGGFEPGFSSADITARIDQVIQDLSPKFSELYNMVPKESITEPTYIWNVRTTDNSSTRHAYTYSENTVASSTNSGTPAQGNKEQLTAVAKTTRTDWEVENFLRDAAFYDAVSDEIQNAISVHIDDLEKQIVTGTAASGYGSANGFLGLRQIVNSFVTIGDTTSVYGITRTSGKTYMDAQVVDAATATFDISYLDSAITKIRKQRAMPGMFVMSYERWDEVNAQLQAQQRFTGSINIAGGFQVMTYNNVPLIRSRYMDKAGESNTDTKVFLIASNNLVLKTFWDIASVDADLGRLDSTGGYIKSAMALVSKRLTQNCVIDDLAVPN